MIEKIDLTKKVDNAEVTVGEYFENFPVTIGAVMRVAEKLNEVIDAVNESEYDDFANAALTGELDDFLMDNTK